MPPHPHPACPDIEPCIQCGEKSSFHTEKGAEKRCNRKKQPHPTAILWRIKGCHTHTKKKTVYG